MNKGQKSREGRQAGWKLLPNFVCLFTIARFILTKY